MSSTANAPEKTASGARTYVQLSIGWHLGIAFAAVTMLAIMANVIVEHGESIVKAISAPLQSTSRATADTAHQSSVSSAESLRIALNNFAPAVRARMQSDTPETRLLLRGVRTALTQQLESYVAATTPNPGVSELTQAIRDFSVSGDKLVAFADSRRRIWNEYSIHVEAINERLKHSLDGAFKLFGRVIARQSLITLGNQLDEIRRCFTAMEKTQLNDQSEIDALIASEQAFGKALQSNRKRLSHSEGVAWVDGMDEDFAQIMALPPLLTDNKSQLLSMQARFNRLEPETRRLLRVNQDQLIRRRDNAVSQKATVSANALPTDGVNTQAEHSSLDMTASAPAPATTAHAADKRTQIAWLSGTTVLLVLLICVRTVRSVSVPVRGLLRGIDELAAGQALRPLPRGTIKELNNLVTAFNAMSEELITARQGMLDSQQQLEMKVAERTRELQELAENDPLTSLPNRRQLFALLASSIVNAAKQQHLVGVYFLDIDNFKNINDSMDHTYGDQVLREVAHRLRGVIGAAGFAARLGGDEFTFVLSRAAHHHEIAAFGQQVMQAFSQAIKVDQRELMVSISIGASIYPEHGIAPEELLKAADSAVYRAKSLGRNQLLMFTPDLLEVASNRFNIEQGLRRALHNNEFELVFQPEVNAETMEVDLVEALIRWRMPNGRVATPGEFLAIAEDSGLIMDISDWVLRTAIETAAQWHHGAWPAARVAINVSPRQLMESRFVEQVEALLREFRLPPACIEIELTENVLQTGPATLEVLLRLRNMGIAIALDDFGSGYSTLASLEQLPLTRIKLDRSLIARIDSNASSLAIARAIIGLCHGLGIQLTAEGIERPEQFAMLASCRAMHLQGYLFARPLQRDDLVAALAQVGQSAQLQLLTMPKPASSANVVEMSAGSARRNSESQRG